jgi:aminoglycoside 3-N-acetyltransferase
MLAEGDGWVLLMGVEHTVNTSIHYAEQLAGRKQFIRWALTPKGVIPCHRFPGCSEGFDSVASHLDEMVRKVKLDEAVVQAIPLGSLVDSVCDLLKDDPSALLCSREDCERCNAVRESLVVQQ